MGALSQAIAGYLQPGRKRRRVAVALLALALPACAYLRPQPDAAVQNPELDELSGLTRSAYSDDWLWGHNDSGDSARLFRVGPQGEDGGVVTVPGAKAVDWEDIASFRWHGQPALLIGDIGDNYARRDHVTLYAIAEPKPGASTATLLWSLDVRYPEGPMDAEGLAVDPADNSILIAGKRMRPPRLYRLAMPTDAPAAAVPATRIGTIDHIPTPTPADVIDDPKYGLLRDWVTALDISPDGRFAIVTTYKNAYRYRHQPGEDWGDTFRREPETIVLPQFKQTEAGAISNDGHWLTVGSEQRAGFARVALPP